MKHLFSTFIVLLMGTFLYAQEHDIEFISNHIYLKADVSGKPAHLVFDTGSADVYLDSIWLAESGLNYPQMVPVIDLRAILGDAADGIFGLRDLKGKVITVDYKNRKLTQSDKVTSAQTEGFTRIPIQTSPNHPGQILIPIEVTISPGKVISGKALLDTGSGQGLEFTSKAAIKYGLDKIEDKVRFHYEHGGVGGESAGYEFGIDKVASGNILLSSSI